jgi:hypothetical protein
MRSPAGSADKAVPNRRLHRRHHQESTKSGAPPQKVGKTTMTKRKATFATTAIMTLLALVIFFVWKFGKYNGLGFAVIEGIFAVYGFSSLADDCCRWLQMPDTAIMQRGGRH